MQPTNDSSPIKKFLDKKGQGLHHMALETDNIEGEVERMEGCGIQFLGKLDLALLELKLLLFIQNH